MKTLSARGEYLSTQRYTIYDTTLVSSFHRLSAILHMQITEINDHMK